MKPDGYRFIRGYRTRAGVTRYALWERQAGRNRRVGTAHSEADYLRFLGFSEERIARWRVA